MSKCPESGERTVIPQIRIPSEPVVVFAAICSRCTRFCGETKSLNKTVPILMSITHGLRNGRVRSPKAINSAGS